VQYTRGVANPTGIHGHVDDLLLHRRRLPSIPIVQEKGAPGTALLAAAVPLLALTGVAMADTVCAVIVGTVEGLENHDATRSCWGIRLQRHPQRIAHQHL
jgi:hypothetical protein